MFYLIISDFSEYRTVLVIWLYKLEPCSLGASSKCKKLCFPMAIFCVDEFFIDYETIKRCNYITVTMHKMCQWCEIARSIRLKNKYNKKQLWNFQVCNVASYYAIRTSNLNYQYLWSIYRLLSYSEVIL